MYRAIGGRGGEGGVEKTGRTDETGSPSCACSGAREQESGKSTRRNAPRAGLERGLHLQALCQPLLRGRIESEGWPRGISVLFFSLLFSFGISLWKIRDSRLLCARFIF